MIFQNFTFFFLILFFFFWKIRLFSNVSIANFFIMWMSKISLALFFSGILKTLNLSQAPIYIDVALILMTIFLFDSIRIWNLITLFLRLEAQLFPRFSFQSDTLLWPQSDYFLKIKSFLKKRGFHFKCALQASPSKHQLALVSSVFYNKQNTVRLQIIFPSYLSKNIVCNSIATSIDTDGTMIATSNVNIPLGFFLSKKTIKNSQMKTVIQTINFHLSRIKKHKNKLENFNPDNTVDEVNKFFTEQENHALKEGFLQKNTKSCFLTQEGCYKLWMSILRTNYIGI